MEESSQLLSVAEAAEADLLVVFCFLFLLFLFFSGTPNCILHPDLHVCVFLCVFSQGDPKLHIT